MKNFQKRRIATYVHQCLTNNVCKNFENYFEVTESKINTRNSGTLIRLPKVKVEVTRKSFSFQGGYEYNTSFREFRSENNHQNFKGKIRGNFIISKTSGLGCSLFYFSPWLFCLDDCCVFSV